MNLTDKEKKLILLAFNAGAQPGEAVGAIRALAKIWIGKYQDGYDLLKDLEKQGTSRKEQFPHQSENPFADFRLGFGKYAGSRLGDIPTDYLIYAIHNFTAMWPSTRDAIERYLGIKK